jgi:pyruvyltransferase
VPQIVHWNPRRRLAASGPLWRIPLLRRENNFGDLLGPWIVDRIRAKLGLGAGVSNKHRLLTVGSIINIAGQEGDVVWGSGIHGNHLPLCTPFPRFDIRAVRGPQTARVLRETGNDVPNVFGDPGLLVPHLWSDRELGVKRGSGGTVCVPNFYDLADAPPNSLNPRGNLGERVRLIASAELVLASSLHGIVIAEAYGVPAVLVASASERRFKYEDYYGGTGRDLPSVALDWHSAGKTSPAEPISDWDYQPLLEAFPIELWHTQS